MMQNQPSNKWNCVKHGLVLNKDQINNLIKFLTENQDKQLLALNWKWLENQDHIEIHFKSPDDLQILTLHKNETGSEPESK